MKKKVHIVNHTHWDREWYFTTLDALLLSDQLFTEAFDELENHPEAKFVLDGQISILEEYLTIHPERVAQVKDLMAKRQLFIGPWYTQTDSFFPSGESILRNLAVGVAEARKYGVEMKVGYLPDTFGHNAQTPTILANAGLDNVIFWRGINFENQVSSPYFVWHGLGDKKIYAVNMPEGYGTAAFLEATENYLNERLLPSIREIEKHTDHEVLIPSGGDQLAIVNDLQEKLTFLTKHSDYEFELSSYEDFITYLRNVQNLPEYQGEFREPVYARVHKTIGSVRSNLKVKNFQLEQKLLKRVEPLIAIAEAHGITVSRKLLLRAWKTLLEGQAHDSMGGCVTDNVAEDIIHRAKEVDEIADGIENFIVKKLSDKLGLSEKEVLVFNTDVRPFQGYKYLDFLSPTKFVKFDELPEAVIVSTQYFEGKKDLLLETAEEAKYINEAPYWRLTLLAKVDLPAMGYKVFTMSEGETEEIQEIHEIAEQSISNDFYTVKFNKSDKSSLTLETIAGQIYENFLELEDDGNDGDTYDFSPLAGDFVRSVKFDRAVVKHSALLQKMLLSADVALPYSLTDRLSDVPKYGKFTVSLEISLRKGSENIDCRLMIDNQVLSHRLRVKVNTGSRTNESLASLPFGFIKRQAQSSEISDWQQKYVEYPIDIEPFETSISAGQATIFSKGLKEYQLRNGQLYLTIFATTSQLGKPNLVYRPGRASGDTTKKGHVMVETPLAEMQGQLNFDFGLNFTADLNEHKISELWQEYNDLSVSYQKQKLNQFIHRLDNKIQETNLVRFDRRIFSLMKFDSPIFQSSFSPSLYDLDAYLLRLSNPTAQKQPLKPSHLKEFFQKIEFVNVVEEPVKFDGFVPAYDFVTLKLWK